MKQALTTSLKDIPTLAKTIASSLHGGEIFALIGTLGAGKTTFVKAVGKELKIKHHITSPTFTLLNCFPVKIKNKQILVYHLDLYRTKNFAEAKSLGLTEFWGQSHAVTFIEWADKIKTHLPPKTRVIKFLN
ncbi:MAG: tRNA (adenosine(37)-N6)-threonylcarbamoyltransferase complex ATPase subunit type 1 TsaE [Patescibacteria group bacterium]